ncbi:uncharacterized protein J3R85_004208 [Psidium guajava]|nr:uncharacterized protein J3R85_004208 [Psidium guajava]
MELRNGDRALRGEVELKQSILTGLPPLRFVPRTGLRLLHAKQYQLLHGHVEKNKSDPVFSTAYLGGIRKRRVLWELDNSTKVELKGPWGRVRVKKRDASVLDLEARSKSTVRRRTRPSHMRDASVYEEKERTRPSKRKTRPLPIQKGRDASAAMKDAPVDIQRRIYSRKSSAM